MTKRLMVLSVVFMTSALAQDGFKPIFDGRSLDGWTCKLDTVWRVQDGAIVGENTKKDPIPDNMFLIWQGGEVADFELKLKFKIEGPANANSGIQFRGTTDDSGHVIGYQADIDRAGKWLGALYDEHTGRKLLAARGQTTDITKDGTRTQTEHAKPAVLLNAVNLEGWNDYHISAKGETIELRINGQLTAKVVDRQEGEFDAKGILALQVHRGPPMTIHFKDIQLKQD